MLKTLHLTRPAGSSRELRDRWLGDNDLAAYSEEERPKTRGDCLPGGSNASRPCPWMCRFNLYLDVSSRGSIKFNHPHLEVEEMPADASCALDIASRWKKEGAPIGVVAAAMNLAYDNTHAVIVAATKHARAIAAEETTAASKPRVDRPHRRATDPDLDDVPSLVRASHPVFKKAPHRDLSRAEVETLYPGAPISPEYGQPRLQPQDEDRQPRARAPRPWERR